MQVGNVTGNEGLHVLRLRADQRAGRLKRPHGAYLQGEWAAGVERRSCPSLWSRAFPLGFRPEHMRGFDLQKEQSKGQLSFGEAEGRLTGLRWPS